MAEEKKAYYPMLPIAHWWKLREKFKQSIPGVVTDSYLAAALDTKAESARKNILPYLKTIGIIDEDGKTNQELAKAWRDDAEYSNVCIEIRDKLYPGDLIAAISNPSEDRGAVERWFANHTGSGESAVRRMAIFYITLSEADILKKPEKEAQKDKPARKQKQVLKKAVTREPGNKIDIHPQPLSVGQANLPSVYINLEIHISADATPDQIDKMFESMAKHIYKK